MKRKAIVWDIDDVLTPTSHAFYQAALRTHGYCPHPDAWTDYLWGQHIGLPEGLETQQYLIEHRVIETCEPYDYTDQALSLTKAAGFLNILLSARAWHPRPWWATMEWAARYVLDSYIDVMEFVKVEEPKHDRLMKICEDYDVRAFVEDNHVHAVAAIAIVPQVFHGRRAWNKDYESSPDLLYVNTALEAARQITQE